MAKLVLEGIVWPESDDGGLALIAEIDTTNAPSNPTDGFFVRLQSWDETKEHPFMKSLEGRNVRITIEPI